MAGPDPLGLAGHLGPSCVASYQDLAAAADGTPAPAVVAVNVPAVTAATGGDVPGLVRHACTAVLEELQHWLGSPLAGRSLLAVVTQGAVAVREDDAASARPAALAGAGVWGLVRSAQAEEPGRFVLVDTDGTPESAAAMPAAVASGEPQVALRGGQVLVPRLGRVPLRDPAAEPGPETLKLQNGPVLVTGGTGTLGGLVARHLVAGHGARELVLASRRGPGAPGAGRLAAALAELGAAVRVTACDAADRDALAGLIGRGGPLAAVVHCAGVLDDGAVGSLTARRLGTALAPKADAAWHLHELTAGMDLEAFALFSSAAGVLGTPGQGNYAAANAFLDALAAWRSRQGLAGLSLAWGFWEQASGMTGHLDQQDLARLRRAGIAPLSSARALELFDAGLAGPDPAVVAARIDTATLADLARAGTLPAVLRGLVRSPASRCGGTGQSAVLPGGWLGWMPAGQRELLLEVVRAQAASVLGHGSPSAVEADRAFRDVGFDSLTAVELRNRLAALTGLKLPATLAFDYPTPAVLASHLLGQLRPDSIPQRAAGATEAVAAHEPVAVVGVGCRFPGGAGSAEELWGVVAGGVDAVGDFPGDRGWDLPEGGRGGFLHDAAWFDAAFFGISPREALAMDPQQRLLLECAWQALEDAGIDPAGLRGSDTAVFAGVIYHDYGPRGPRDAGDADGFRLTGTAGERGLGAGVVRVRAGGPGGVGGYGVLVGAGGAAPGVPVAAAGGVLAGAGGRGDGDGDPGGVRGVRPAGGAGGGRAVQAVRGGGGRDGVVGGRGGAGGGAAVGRGAARAADPGGGAGQRGELRRGV